MNYENSRAPGAVAELEDIEKILDEMEHERIKVESFIGSGILTDEAIHADLNKCKEKQEMIERATEAKSPAEIEKMETGLLAEYAFRHAIQDHGWLTENVKMILASQYDDYFRGIDSVAEIAMNDEETEHIGFAIDFATSAESAGEKLSKTYFAFDQGFCPSLKYFESEKTGRVSGFKVPRIVIGAGPDALGRLSRYSMELMNGSGISDSVKQEIKDDSFRYVMFGEIMAQLGSFCERLKKVISEASKNGRKDIAERATDSLSIHMKAFNNVMKLMEEADVSMHDVQVHIRGDSFAKSIGSALSMLSQTPINLDKKTGTR